MKIALDVHTHTLASGHAFSTLQEMAQAAADKGLELLGITEHTPGIPGTCDLIYFRNLHVVPRRMYGVDLLLGAEINILDTEGRLDLDEAHMKKLDLRIAGIHSLCYRPGTPEENTQGLLRVIANPYITSTSSAIPVTVRPACCSNPLCRRRRNTTRCSKSTTAP